MNVIIVINKNTLLVEEVVGIFFTDSGAKDWAKDHYDGKDNLSYSIERIQQP